MNDQTEEKRPDPLTSRRGERMFEAALKRALLAQDGKLLRRIADRLAAYAANAKKLDLQAVKEVLDRIDGKPRQAVEMTGAQGGPLTIRDEGSSLGAARRVAFLMAEAALERAASSSKETVTPQPARPPEKA